jgi:hypothetical protein
MVRVQEQPRFGGTPQFGPGNGVGDFTQTLAAHRFCDPPRQTWALAGMFASDLSSRCGSITLLISVMLVAGSH